MSELVVSLVLLGVKVFVFAMAVLAACVAVVGLLCVLPFAGVIQESGERDTKRAGVRRLDVIG